MPSQCVESNNTPVVPGCAHRTRVGNDQQHLHISVRIPVRRIADLRLGISRDGDAQVPTHPKGRQARATLGDRPFVRTDPIGNVLVSVQCLRCDAMPAAYGSVLVKTIGSMHEPLLALGVNLS
jgi:hypothetical protein